MILVRQIKIYIINIIILRGDQKSPLFFCGISLKATLLGVNESSGWLPVPANFKKIWKSFKKVMIHMFYKIFLNESFYKNLFKTLTFNKNLRFIYMKSFFKIQPFWNFNATYIVRG